MKILNVYQNGSSIPITLIDDDNSNLNEYSKKVSDILESKNVVILSVSSGSLVIRPHTITSILISDDEEIKPNEEIDDSLDEEKKEEPIDIITEID